jgi:hypothetical protein
MRIRQVSACVRAGHRRGAGALRFVHGGSQERPARRCSRRPHAYVPCIEYIPMYVHVYVLNQRACKCCFSSACVRNRASALHHMLALTTTLTLCKPCTHSVLLGYAYLTRHCNKREHSSQPHLQLTGVQSRTNARARSRTEQRTTRSRGRLGGAHCRAPRLPSSKVSASFQPATCMRCCFCVIHTVHYHMVSQTHDTRARYLAGIL